MVYPADKETWDRVNTNDIIQKEHTNNWEIFLEALQDTLGLNITMGETDLKAYLDILDAIKHTQNTDTKIEASGRKFETQDPPRIQGTSENACSIQNGLNETRLDIMEIVELVTNQSGNQFTIQAVGAFEGVASLIITEFPNVSIDGDISQDDTKLMSTGEMKIKYYEQATEPVINSNGFMAMWKDTDDSNRIYLVFRRGDGDNVKVELT